LVFVKVFRSEILSDFRRLGFFVVGLGPVRCRFWRVWSVWGAVPVGGCVWVVVVKLIDHLEESNPGGRAVVPVR
jgi:peptidoglycan/LPS O-acetylase OafA/YrhL